MIRDDRHPGAPELADEPDRLALEATWAALAHDSEWTSSHAEALVVPAESTDAAWERLSSALFDDAVGDAPGAVDVAAGSTFSVVTATARTRRVLRAGGWFGVAAAAAVAAISLVPVQRSAAPGTTMAVVLPEGSRVELNGGSTLSWTRGLGWLPGVPSTDREVRLEGEAFFEVTRDGTRFSVVTRDARVTVLGTRFNVRALPTSPTRVTVEEGRVAVSHRDGRGRVELTAGDGAGLAPDGRVTVDAEPALLDFAWRSGGLTLRDLTVDAVVDALQRRFGERVILRGTDADSVPLTIHYSQRVDLETVLADLAAARGWTVNRTAEGWELVRE